MTETVTLNGFLSGGWRDLAFEHFRDGVDICRLVRGEPELALLRYRPGAEVPKHYHPGLETILVLEGSQSDENGLYTAGTLVTNPEGTVHSVQSEEGCVVLIQWQKPVKLLE
ncbi:cupin domain-containing protein [Allorhizobium sp. BGMRC 0089]|uniref:cupin domain-containing protein n=1 Tax=Allorhizobium sonneratiae TaxID=2934936 RepID=UPI002033FA41|nr:cupin domain-containing protein [Allorhizobium sonneratiae]MCM2292308.1 cupin domain-containing protein [Allorhizobium sonneratiae]